MKPFIVSILSTGAFPAEGSSDIYIHHRRREDVLFKVLKEIPTGLCL